ncbi:MAG: alanine dehydrogenase [Pseudomonadota bacterium]
MRIGIPKETKNHEYRVAAPPASVAELVRAGHQVLVQSMAGHAIGYDDEAYRTAGAMIVTDPAVLYRDCDLIYKVKEPLADELPLLRPGQILFCYLHLAAAPELAHTLLERGVTAIAFETVTDARGATPLLAPMSQIAGRLALQMGMQALEMKNGGRGVLLSGVPGVAPGRVVILGGGNVGGNAARLAVGIGADVTLLERNPDKLKVYDDLYQGRLKTRFATPANIEECLSQADLTIGAAYVPGRHAPRLIDRRLLRRMPRGSALVDVSIDQGGTAETSRPTSHSEPFFLEEGVVHYCVPNMPGAVARTSTLALAEATLPYLMKLAGLGPRRAFEQDAGFAAGLNLAQGRLAHPGLAEDLGLVPADWRELV